MSEIDHVEETPAPEPAAESNSGNPRDDIILQGDPGPPEMEYFEKGEKVPNG